MKHRTLVLPLIAFAAILLPGFLRAQTPSDPDPSAKALPSIQRQIDELKAGQERILKELENIQSLLRDAPARSDFPSRPVPPENISLGVRGEMFRGDRNARVALMEYSDFDCSFCSKYAMEIYPRLAADYIKPGKIKYFFRDLPAPGHTNSLFKARAARCAGDQGRFWEMHDWLFAHPGSLTEQDLAAEVKALDLDSSAFSECLESGRFSENIQRSAGGARRMGLNGTPAFLIGVMSDDGDTIRVAKVLIGAETYEGFQAVLDPLLNPPTKK